MPGEVTVEFSDFYSFFTAAVTPDQIGAGPLP